MGHVKSSLKGWVAVVLQSLNDVVTKLLQSGFTRRDPNMPWIF
ncbi:hypothetical protein BH20ACI3_BH20ACI3_23300 [soil metagenome]